MSVIGSTFRRLFPGAHGAVVSGECAWAGEAGGTLAKPAPPDAPPAAALLALQLTSRDDCVLTLLPPSGDSGEVEDGQVLSWWSIVVNDEWMERQRMSDKFIVAPRPLSQYAEALMRALIPTTPTAGKPAVSLSATSDAAAQLTVQYTRTGDVLWQGYFSLPSVPTPLHPVAASLLRACLPSAPLPSVGVKRKRSSVGGTGDDATFFAGMDATHADSGRSGAGSSAALGSAAPPEPVAALPVVSAVRIIGGKKRGAGLGFAFGKGT